MVGFHSLCKRMRICSLCCDVACVGFVCENRNPTGLAALLAHVRTIHELDHLMKRSEDAREVYEFYFQPISVESLLPRLKQAPLGQYIDTITLRPTGVLVRPKRGRDAAQAFLSAILKTLDYEKSEVRLDTVPPFAQRINWVAYYSNGDPNVKSAFKALVDEYRWPNDYFDEDYIGFYGHHLDIPRN